jgi:hypothetical protein
MLYETDESRLQNGTFIYKMGFLDTNCAFHLQNGILAIQTGFKRIDIQERNM